MAFRETPLKLLKSYLSNRQQFVEVKKTRSETLPMVTKAQFWKMYLYQACAQMRAGAFKCKCKRRIKCKCKCKCAAVESNGSANANAQQLNQMQMQMHLDRMQMHLDHIQMHLDQMQLVQANNAKIGVLWGKCGT